MLALWSLAVVIMPQAYQYKYLKPIVGVLIVAVVLIVVDAFINRKGLVSISTTKSKVVNLVLAILFSLSLLIDRYYFA